MEYYIRKYRLYHIFWIITIIVRSGVTVSMLDLWSVSRSLSCPVAYCRLDNCSQYWASPTLSVGLLNKRRWVGGWWFHHLLQHLSPPTHLQKKKFLRRLFCSESFGVILFSILWYLIYSF
jgi:hypothetical protein